MSDLITIDIEDGVADVRLNRPDKYNALSPDMFLAITEAAASVGSNPSVRCVVLSGSGKGFCAGLDFQSFQAMAGDDAPARSSKNGSRKELLTPNGPGTPPQNAAYAWKTVPQPVIAALHGVAYGGGFQIAMGADIRIARPDARLSVMEIKWGLIPDMGITMTAPGVVRLDVMKELTFTGRVVAGEEARDLGLVTRISETPLEDALTLAREVAGKSPQAIRAGKKLFAEAWEAPAAQALALEAGLQGSLIGTPNQMEAVRANMENRAPSFADPEANA